jgi:hypothetical protein
MTESKREAPSRIYKAGEAEIRMCHGLMCDFQRMVPDASSAVNYILNDSFVRDYLVRRALTPSRKSIEKLEDLVDHDEVDLDTDEVLSLVDWISEHLLYFFVKSAENLSRMTTRLDLPVADETNTSGLTLPSEDGSQA